MGMFDYVKLLDDDTKVVCGEGHVQHELQTKDHENTMTTLYVLGGQLYAHRGEVVVSTPLLRDGVLVMLQEQYADKSGLTATLVVYSSCYACDPVCTEGKSGWLGETVGTHRPWLEYELVFKSGVLADVTPLKVETRDQVRKQLTADGVAVLPDDDRVAKRTIELYRKKS